MKVIRLHHVSITVNDTKAALDFYCDILGFTLNETRPELSFPGAWLDVGDLQIHLIERDTQINPTGSEVSVSRDNHTAFYIDAMDELKQSLTDAGIPYTESQRRPALFCRDPDGNGLEFISK